MGLGTILGGIASSEAAENEREVQRANQEAWERYRQQMMDEFAKSRGSDGNAFLPMYFGSGKDSFETQAANDFRALYNAQKTDPVKQMQQYRTTAGYYQPMQDAARGALGGVFDGTFTEGRLQNAQPVFQARKNLAATQKQGVLQALQERVNALNADNARKGFTGTGSFAQNRLLQSTIGARQAAAQTSAGADLANAEDARAIRDYGMQLKLDNLETPYRMAQNDLFYLDMPARLATQAYLDRLRPMDAFRIGTAMAPVVQPMPEKAIPTDSQIWWQVGADVAQEMEDTAKQAAMAYFGGGMGGMGGGGGGGGGSKVPTYTGSQGFSAYGPYAGGYRMPMY